MDTRWYWWDRNLLGFHSPISNRIEGAVDTRWHSWDRVLSLKVCMQPPLTCNMTSSQLELKLGIVGQRTA